MESPNLLNVKNKPGDIYFRLTLREYLGKSKWLCDCICGKTRITSSKSLRAGKAKSCGCWQFVDKTGRRYGKLTVLELVKIKGEQQSWWKCQCDCGEITTIRTADLRDVPGGNKSCGCGRVTNGKIQAAKHLGGKRREANVNWRSDLTLQERYESKHRSLTPELSEWRKDVYKKDSYTCQITGIKGYRLTAHHLADWKTYPDLRVEISNGITLTNLVHRLFHSEYGQRKTRPEYFEDFKKRCLAGEFDLILEKIKEDAQHNQRITLTEIRRSLRIQSTLKDRSLLSNSVI